MNIEQPNQLFNQETEAYLDQIKEELMIFLEYPSDHLLLDLICSDLDMLELHSIELGLDDLHYFIKKLHDHLHEINLSNKSLDENELDSCMEDIHVIEKVLDHYKVAS
jgi:chemotaxis protein histidine kinase CheA